jgi:hypothetical protein
MRHQRLTPEIMERFSDLANSLSPENLACDGEASVAEARDRRKKLLTEWWALEDSIGMKVTQEMVSKWEEDNAKV